MTTDGREAAAGGADPPDARRVHAGRSGTRRAEHRLVVPALHVAAARSGSRRARSAGAAARRTSSGSSRRARHGLQLHGRAPPAAPRPRRLGAVRARSSSSCPARTGAGSSARSATSTSSDVHIGMDVELVWRDVRDGETVPTFRPARRTAIVTELAGAKILVTGPDRPGRAAAHARPRGERDRRVGRGALHRRRGPRATRGRGRHLRGRRPRDDRLRRAPRRLRLRAEPRGRQGRRRRLGPRSRRATASRSRCSIARTAATRAFLHCSSTAVYEHQGPEHALVETDPLGDNHRVMFPTYSLAKIAAEVVARAAAREHGVPTTIARLNVPYGDNGGWPGWHLEFMLARPPDPAAHRDGRTCSTRSTRTTCSPCSPRCSTPRACPRRSSTGAGAPASIEEWCGLLGELTGLEAEVRGDAAHDRQRARRPHAPPRDRGPCVRHDRRGDPAHGRRPSPGALGVTSILCRR